MNCMNCGNLLSPDVKFCPKCGSPIAQSAPYTPPAQYTPPARQVQSSWSSGGPQSPQPPRRKSRAGKILLILATFLILVVAGAGAAIYYGYRYVEGNLKSSEAYQSAEAALKQSDAVAAKLGEIRETGFPVGTYKVDADGSGFATYTMSVVGTKASGRYFVSMERKAGTWRIMRAFVKLDDGEDVSIVSASEEGSSGERPSAAAAAPDEVNANPEDDDTASAGGKTISGGVLNGKAISKPQPPYPALAKAVRASGTVVVSVVVDERGRVIQAEALSGHPLLRPVCVTVARQARLSPTLLAGKPVKVRGTLTYEFKPE
ncbi:MAG: TonB family protein [Acidobacteria bacterium]|nr:TonB family protein [Acidobacteriota bacterium]